MNDISQQQNISFNYNYKMMMMNKITIVYNVKHNNRIK
jgi:hypothetical protein